MTQALTLRFLLQWMILPMAAVLAFGIAAFGGSTAYAYNDSGPTPCVWQYEENTTLRPLYVNDPDYPPNGAYATAYSQARSAWNGSDTPVLFQHDNSQSKHTIGVRDLGLSGPLGRTDWSCLAWFNKRSATLALLNSDRLDSKSANYKRSVATHELGHYIGTRHSSESPAVMNSSRNRNTIYLVYEDDECAVNDRYSHTDYPVTCD